MQLNEVWSSASQYSHWNLPGMFSKPRARSNTWEPSKCDPPPLKIEKNKLNKTVLLLMVSIHKISKSNYHQSIHNLLSLSLCKSQQEVNYENITNNQFWWECNEKRTLIHGWWEWPLVQLLRKTARRFLKNVRTSLYGPVILLLGIYTWTTHTKKKNH